MGTIRKQITFRLTYDISGSASFEMEALRSSDFIVYDTWI